MNKNTSLWVGIAGIIGASILYLNTSARHIPSSKNDDTEKPTSDANGRIELVQELLCAHISKGHPKDTLLDSILRTVTAQVGAQSAAILLLQGEGASAKFAVSNIHATGSSATLHRRPNLTPRISEAGPEGLGGLAGYCLTEKQKVNVADASKDLRYLPSVDASFTSYQDAPVSLLYVPIISGDSVMGVIQVTNKLGNPAVFTQDDEAFVEEVAIICACAIEREALAHQAHLADRKANALLEVMRSSRDREDLHTLLLRVSHAARAMLLADRVTVFLVDQHQKRLFFSVVHDSLELQDVVIPMGQGIVGYVAETGEVVNIENAYKDVRFDRSIDKSTGYRTKSILCMPVFSLGQKKPVAVIQALNKNEGDARFTSSDAEAMGCFCREVGKLLAMKTMETLLLKNNATLQTNKEESPSSLMCVEFLSQYLTRPTASTAFRRRSAKGIIPLYLPMPSPQENTMTGSPQAFSFHPPPFRRAESIGEDLDSSDQKALDDWNLDVHNLPEGKMDRYLLAIFNSFELPGGVTLVRSKLKNFISAVKNRYQENPFHNWRHAFSVCHITYMILTTGGLVDYLNAAAIYGTLIAAVCHDLDHPGNDNRFEINQRSELSIMFADDSVLERHHLHVCRRILTKEDNIFFDEFSEEDQKEIYRVIAQAILGTDMVHHFKHVEKLTRCLNSVQSETSGQPPFSPENPEDRVLLATMIVHAADLSGQCLKRELADDWGRRISKEFTHQSERESLLGLPVTTFMVGLDDETKFNTLQFNFLANVLHPLWDVFGKLFPSLSIIVEGLQKNLEFYQSQIQENINP
mmetsp:Transcript_2728/g.3576  ORF Transcript_2728/g.3576 Transcript_2728/m.3576 type:complete len:808 (-) Transcript_2728:146-2569(-)